MAQPVITGTGSWLPAQRVTSAELEQRLNLPQGWCSRRVGINERRRAEEPSYVLGARAARKALDQAGLHPDELDMVLFHASFGEYVYPTPGVFLQRELGMSRPVPVLEVKAACAAFVAALHLASALIRSGSAKRILLVQGEKLQEVMESYERSAPLFGDAGAAVVLEARPEAGLLHAELFTQGAGGGSCLAATPALRGVPPEWEQGNALWSERSDSGYRTWWNGDDIFRNAVRCMGSATLAALEHLDLGQADHYLYHQANAKILKSLVRQYKLPPERVHSNISELGNTSSATVPLLLDQGLRSGRIKPGDTVLMAALGAGYTYGVAVYRVPERSP